MTTVLTPEAYPLDPAEKARLARLERTVDRAVEVAGKIAGEALATIRDEKLYRRTHSTFEAYVEARFGVSRSTAYRMIEAASVPAPQLDPVEGLSRGETNPQPPESPRSAPGRPDSPFVIPEPAEPTPPVEVRMPADAERLWGEVVDLDDGVVTIRVDPAWPYPAWGQRVLVAWTR